MASPEVLNSDTDLDGKTLLVLETAATVTGGLTPASDSVQVGWVLRKKVTIADAAIKTLPTTPVDLVPAAGANTIVQLIGGLWAADTSAGAYTNINASAFFSVRYADTSNSSIYVVNDGTITGGHTDNVTWLLGGAHLRKMRIQPYFDVDTSGTWGLLPSQADDGVNSKLQIVFDNNSGGVLTGGNSANTLKVIVYYVVITLT